ncbi:Sec-independent protein translocase subunit TatA [Microbacterium sp. NPDC055910]|uniref:Sec-independent protein translocase subunit TatA n=1 Tax=Microbacterium sp. NPDC055910 TaxID=3345659 RepID=UPI0035DDD1B5
MGIQGWQWLLILAVILLLFGAAKLPALAKSMGQSARVFKGEMKAMKEDDKATDSATTSSVADPSHSVPASPTENSSNSGGASNPKQ